MYIAINTTPLPPTIPLNPATLDFGKVFAPNMFRQEYHNGSWANGRIERLQNLTLHPATSVFHYGQEIFEGLKAYRHDNGAVYLFRPREHLERMNLSARRMCMPTVDVESALQALQKLIEIDQDWLPSIPGSLYLRPTMIATTVALGAVPAEAYEYFIISCPVGGLFTGAINEVTTVNIYVCEEYVRAAPGGTGMVKTGGNYAGSLLAMRKAHEEGCQQVLFLSAQSPKSVEELGGMNVCFVRKNVLVTPALSDGTILDGITRRSILTLASEFVEISQDKIYFDDLLADIQKGNVTEGFICGTGAGIVAINSLKYRGKKIQIGNGEAGPFTNKLFEMLASIKDGNLEDKYDWLVKVV
jgi:branched-chain amino acid aminotransferase